MSTTKGNATEKKTKVGERASGEKKAGKKEYDIEEAPKEVRGILSKLSALNDFIKTCSDDEIEIGREIKVKPEWKKRFDEIRSIYEEEKKLEAKRKTFGKRIWADIEIDLGIFDKSMRYDEERGVIKIEK